MEQSARIIERFNPTVHNMHCYTAEVYKCKQSPFRSSDNIVNGFASALDLPPHQILFYPSRCLYWRSDGFLSFRKELGAVPVSPLDSTEARVAE
jgi:hypothetical protein